MTYDHEITLIKETGNYIENDIGDLIPETIEKTILCAKKSITRNEFYSAAQAGIKPEIVFVIHGYEYDGEKKLKFEDEEYRVIRTYSTDFEEIELTCEKVIDNANA